MLPCVLAGMVKLMERGNQAFACALVSTGRLYQDCLQGQVFDLEPQIRNQRSGSGSLR
jgi:hypothetical protein